VCVWGSTAGSRVLGLPAKGRDMIRRNCFESAFVCVFLCVCLRNAHPLSVCAYVCNAALGILNWMW